MTLKTLGTSKQSPKYRLLAYLEPLPSLIKVGAYVHWQPSCLKLPHSSKDLRSESSSPDSGSVYYAREPTGSPTLSHLRLPGQVSFFFSGPGGIQDHEPSPLPLPVLKLAGDSESRSGA